MILLEREPTLEALAAALAEATAGQGRIALVCGEAGIGKTALVEHFIRRAQAPARPRALGDCDSLFTPRPLGPLHDIARAGRRALPAQLDAARRARGSSPPSSSELRRAGRPSSSSSRTCTGRTRRRSTSSSSSAAASAAARAARPDLSRRRGRPAPPAAHRAGRPGHLAGGAPAAAAAAVGRRRCAPSPPASRSTPRRCTARPAAIRSSSPRSSPAAGAASRRPCATRCWRARRASRRRARAALDAAAVVGARVEPWLLAGCVGDAAGASTSACALGMLAARRATCWPSGTSWRAQAILDTIAPPRRARAPRPGAERRMAAPPAGARRPRAPGPSRRGRRRRPPPCWPTRPRPPRAPPRSAPIARPPTQYAARCASPATAPPAERARLLEAYADECHLVDHLDEAIRARGEAIDIWREAGDRLREGAKPGRRCRRAGPRRPQRGGRGGEPRAPSPSWSRCRRAPSWPHAYRIQANLRMLDRDRAEAVRWGRKAIALAERFGDGGDRRGGLQHDGRGHAGLRGRRSRARCIWRRASPWPARRRCTSASSGGLSSIWARPAASIYRFADADRYLTEGIRLRRRARPGLTPATTCRRGWR